MRLLTFFSIAVLLMGCNNSGSTWETRTVIIDSCEYIQSGWDRYEEKHLTHKGNCNNPIHSNKQ